MKMDDITVAAPPFRIVNQDVDTEGSLPLEDEPVGTLKLDKNGNLVKSYLTKFGINPFIRDYYNWLKNELPEQIKGPYELNNKLFKDMYSVYFLNPRL